MNFQMFKLVLEKAEEPQIKLLTSTGSSKKQESSRKTAAAAAAESLQSCLTLCDPIDSSPPGSPVQKQTILKRGGTNTQKNYTEKIFLTQITMIV